MIEDSSLLLEAASLRIDGSILFLGGDIFLPRGELSLIGDSSDIPLSRNFPTECEPAPRQIFAHGADDETSKT